MKAENLQILADHQIPVPPFTTVSGGETADLSFSRGERFAVRSSFGLEDDAKNSFAGQFLTRLNVPRADVPHAIEEVRASYRQADAYLRARGIQGDGGDTVIVQEMVDARMSGVMFTVNPMGILNETVITLGYGLGSGVVEDRVETATFYYNRDDRTFYVRERPPFLPEEGILPRLVDLAAQIRSLFSEECDIEFAIGEEGIFILQTRPITTLERGKTVTLDNSNIVESYPGVSLPLTQDFVREIYRDIFQSCVRRVANDEELSTRLKPTLAGMVACCQGSIYYQIDNWYQLLHLLPFSPKLIGIWQDMLGVENRTVPPPDFPVGRRVKVRVAIRFCVLLICVPRLMKKLNRHFAEIYPIDQGKIGKTDDIGELLALYREIRQSITDVWDITLINDMYAFLFTGLSRKMGSRKIADIKNMASMGPVSALSDLIRTAKEKGFDSPEYRVLETAYIGQYGDRGPGELKLETRTFRTHPELLRESVQSRMETPCPESRKKPPVRVINPIVRAARRGIFNREASRLNRSRLFGLAREIFLKIGEILCRQGELEEPQEVFYLYEDELEGPVDRKSLVAKRRTEYADFSEMTHPHRLVFADRCVLEGNPSGQYPVGQGRIVSDGDGSVLRGIGASPGCVRGEVVVLEQPDVGVRAAGKIIVTRSTDPGWVFLIESCMGIIAEKGSILSHTAIISRELGKPSLVNVKHAAEILKDGDVVELDAGAGLVRIERRKP